MARLAGLYFLGTGLKASAVISGLYFLVTGFRALKAWLKKIIWSKKSIIISGTVGDLIETSKERVFQIIGPGSTTFYKYYINFHYNGKPFRIIHKENDILKCGDKITLYYNLSTKETLNYDTIRKEIKNNLLNCVFSLFIVILCFIIVFFLYS